MKLISRTGILTLAAAALPVLLPWIWVWKKQPPPRVPQPPPPLKPGEKSEVLIVIAPGDPAWPERPPEPDSTTEASPVIYNTEIIAREVGDELSARGITVTVLPSDQASSAADVIGHKLVVFALPARRFSFGEGFDRFLERVWEEAVRDYPEQTAQSNFAGLVISATAQWGEQTLSGLQEIVRPLQHNLLDQAIFLTSANGNDVIALRDEFASRLAQSLPPLQ